MRNLRVLRLASRAIAITALAASPLPGTAAAQKAAATGAAPASAQKQTPPKSYQIDPAVAAFGRIMATYYQKPAPETVAPLLKPFLAAPDTPATIIATSEAFVAGLIFNDPSFVAWLAPIYAEQTENTSLGLVRAILMSGHKDATKLVDRLKLHWPEKADAIGRLMKQTVPLVTSLEPLSYGAAIDLNWAYFGATGSSRAIETIISALYGLHDIGDTHKLTIGYSAKWSLAAGAMRDPSVAAVCKGQLAGPHGEALRDILSAAEDGNPDRISAEATAALQKYGAPPSSRRKG